MNKKEQIIQLRNHNILRGKDKSSTPIYPVTLAECVLGLDANDGGVINVDSLPEPSEAKEGAIYYDTETGIHYLFDGANFTEINTSVMPVVRKTGTSTALQYGVSIQPNCYNIITIPLAASVEAKPFVFNFIDVPDNTMAGQYVGRFTALADNQAISLYTSTSGVSLHWPDDVIDIEEGHTYEFNLLYDTCLLTDITVTSQTEDEPAPAEPTL